MTHDPDDRMSRIDEEGMAADGTWNRRVIRHACGSLCIHEVHYRRDGSIRSWSQKFTEASDGEDGIEGLREYVESTYEQSLSAMERPILEWDQVPHGPH